jgi:hypothetical protein
MKNRRNFNFLVQHCFPRKFFFVGRWFFCAFLRNQVFRRRPNTISHELFLYFHLWVKFEGKQPKSESWRKKKFFSGSMGVWRRGTDYERQFDSRLFFKLRKQIFSKQRMNTVFILSFVFSVLGAPNTGFFFCL